MPHGRDGRADRGPQRRGQGHGRQGQPLTERRRTGRRAERAALDHYVARGFEVLARNAHFGHLEVDFIVRSGPLVVLVEVRTRGSTSWESAFGSVSAKKRARLREAMERCWREMRSDATIERMRVDCAAVALGDPVTVEIAEAIV